MLSVILTNSFNYLSVSLALPSWYLFILFYRYPHHPSSNPHSLAVPAMSRFERIRAERGHGQATPQAAVAACSPSSRSNDNEHKQGWRQSNQQSPSKNKIKSQVKTFENRSPRVVRECVFQSTPRSTSAILEEADGVGVWTSLVHCNGKDWDHHACHFAHLARTR